MGGNKNTRRNRKARLWRQQFGLCCHCLMPMDKPESRGGDLEATFEHVTPKSQGGYRMRIENLMLAHKICNGRRSSRPVKIVETYHPLNPLLGKIKKLVLI